MKTVLMMLLACVGVASSARANSPPPVAYAARIDGNTVTICTTLSGLRGCPDESGMLRENIDTGEVVRLADLCSGTDCTVDECVEAGRYRYGFSDPLECGEYGDSAAYFAYVEIDAAPVGCTRTGDLPTVHDLGVPWHDEQWMSCAESGGCMGLRGHASALGLQVAAFAAAGVVLLRRRRSR